jgi:hypothetical protein
MSLSSKYSTQSTPDYASAILTHHASLLAVEKAYKHVSLLRWTMRVISFIAIGLIIRAAYHLTSLPSTVKFIALVVAPFLIIVVGVTFELYCGEAEL